MQEKFYLTTAIAYSSRKPHIGNTYEAIMADAVARYKRQRGFDVYFCTGTDEHGQKIEDLAKEAGIAPKEYVDKVAGDIRAIWDHMGVSYDKFIRTTDDYHERTVQHIFKKMYEKGDIYKDQYEGWYCTPCESFFTETQLVDGKCPDCGREVHMAKEEAYKFNMSKYADRLMKHIEENPGFIEPESRQKEMVNNFLKPGLQDLCVSRTSFKWGIPVDFDDKHVVYVWLDALTNYITALGYDVDEQGELYSKYWPADVHIIGKDIMRFHTIYWPIFLMSLDIPLPKKVFGHPWLLFGTDKMSKSKGNVMYADELAEKFTVDGVRHYVLAEMPYGNDGSITYENIITRYNTDLANNLGNLVKRTMDMTKKYFEGIIPAPVAGNAEEIALDDSLRAACAEAVEKVNEYMDGFRVADAVTAIFDMLRRANKYIDETTPWVLAKSEESRGRLGSVLYHLLETIRIGAVLLKPFIPGTADRILAQLNTTAEGFTFGELAAGGTIGTPEVLFARIDEEKMLAQIAEERAAAEAAEAKANAPIEKPADAGICQIGIDDFSKVELRTAQVIAAEPVPKAKKLLKLQLDLGYEQRQVVSGIAQFYQPEELIGKKLIVVANLTPAVLRGVESCGMILCSSGANDDGSEHLRVIFLDPETPLGERIR